MFRENKELRYSIILICLSTILLATVGFSFSLTAGLLAIFSGVNALCIHCATERYRYRRLKKLSSDLDKILSGSATLPIQEYEEGELSALACQIQKMTKCLLEYTEVTKADKKHLAESLADISHQLRTPLTTMNLTATMLRDPELTQDKRTELLDEMRSLLHRTEWLVETLLKLSKLDAGTITLKQESVNVRSLITLAAAPIIIPMELRGQTLSVRCGEETFIGDLIWSAEAVGNILKNCMEHTPEGGNITVTAEETPLFTQLEITDTGSGFDPKDIPHLFERFYKGKNAAQSSYGIGLALARTVIHAQNGTVRAMNTPDGAKFLVKFYKQVL